MRSGEALGQPQAFQQGFSYLLLLVALAMVGASSAAALSFGALQTRRSAEEELLWIGAAYERAFASYRAATPAGRPTRNPMQLDDLLRDPRFPGVRRHLRRIHFDPMTGSRNWGLLRAADGSIEGIYSLSRGGPIKQAGFEGAWKTFNDAERYRQWVFGLSPEKRGAIEAR